MIAEHLYTSFDEFNDSVLYDNPELKIDVTDLSSDSYGDIIKLTENSLFRLEKTPQIIDGVWQYSTNNDSSPQDVSNYNVYRQAVLNYLLTPKGSIVNNREFGNRMIEMIGESRRVVISYFDEMILELAAVCGVRVISAQSSAEMIDNTTCRYTISYLIPGDESRVVQNVILDAPIE